MEILKWLAGAFGGLVVLGILLAGNGEESSSADPSDFASSLLNSQSSTQGLQRGKVGDLIQVGDLDLTIISVEGFNSKRYNQFNDVNVAVTFKATNVRGKQSDTYNLLPSLAFKLVDGNGVGVTPDFCAGCPDEVTSVDLIRGGTITGKVYFIIREDSWREIRFQSFLSTNSAIITP